MIKISDMTMKQTGEGFALSFREKIELAKLLDKLGTSVIEVEGLHGSRSDALRIKSIAAAVNDSIVSAPVELTAESVEQTWNALSMAKHPRLQVCAPVSSVQMEYLFHKKPEAMLSAIDATVRACAKLTDTEFVAQDATRSELPFLIKAIETAIEAGAKTVTVMDTAGTMLPEEFSAFVASLYASVPALKSVTLGVGCADTLSMADSCVIAAIKAGAGEVKCAAYPQDCADLTTIARVLAAKGDELGAKTDMNVTKLSRIVEQICRICKSDGSRGSLFGNEVQEDSDVYLTAHDDCDAVCTAVERLGYDLSQEDRMKVYEAFMQLAQKRDKVSIRELDAIVASAAMQVPSAYKLDNYVITSGNTVAATAHMKLLKDGTPMEGVYLGDGPIDAAFSAIEQITGRYYELDDFQIQSVTEGSEALGQTIVKLRSDGKLYSGRGISTDIVGASIKAYLNALNKIVYEEEEA
jgi:2-isopropylmalate synthase